MQCNKTLTLSTAFSIIKYRGEFCLESNNASITVTLLFNIRKTFSYASNNEK